MAVSKKDPNAQNGKKPYQKEKPFIVLQYLLMNTDSNNVATTSDIIQYLDEVCGIYAERRSIYRDIDEINCVLWMLENETTMEEAYEWYETAEKEDKFIVYDGSRKGFYVQRRHYSAEDIKLMAECVYATKFISQSRSLALVDTLGGFLSKYEAESLKHDAFLTDRTKTQNKSTLANISIINDAISERINGKPHAPEKIKFKYLEFSIDNLDKAKVRRKGNSYTVSPYRLFINDGNYYLLAVNEKNVLKTFRIDKMSSVELTGSKREGEDAAAKVDLSKYAQQSFSMFGGQTTRVKIRFISYLFDTIFERFGKQGGVYERADDKHFYVTADVNVSDQFFAWLCGFGKRAKIIEPEEVRKGYQAHLKKISEMYE